MREQRDLDAVVELELHQHLRLDEFDILVDRQYRQITDLVQKGRRRTPEARALVRGLLAMEGHAAEDVRVSERDVNRRALTATRSCAG